MWCEMSLYESGFLCIYTCYNHMRNNVDHFKLFFKIWNEMVVDTNHGSVTLFLVLCVSAKYDLHNKGMQTLHYT